MNQPPHTPVRQILFDARDYLNRHFTGPLAEKNTVLMRFYAKLYQEIKPKSLLEFGGGPTIYSIISAPQSVEWIHFVDYSPGCREAVEHWLSGANNSFDWKPYIRYSLEVERGSSAGDADVLAREALLRKSIRAVSACDAWADDPLLGNSLTPYDVIASNFCLEGITEDKEDWFWLNENITRGFGKGSYYTINCLWGVSSYVHDGVTYPSTNLQPEDLEKMYKGLGYKILRLEKTKLSENYGYMMACGEKE